MFNSKSDFTAHAELISIPAIKDTVEKKIYEYTAKYGTPHYIKLPIMIYNCLRKSTDLIVYAPKQHERFMDLIVCPTKSIQTIREIEVF